MPGFDGTGPAGAGPATGGRKGFCTGVLTGTRPLNTGRGFFCRGGGFGRRNRFFATGLTGWQRNGADFSSKKEKAEVLKGQARYIEEQLNNVSERLDSLEKGR